MPVAKANVLIFWVMFWITEMRAQVKLKRVFVKNDFRAHQFNMLLQKMLQSVCSMFVAVMVPKNI